MGVKAKTLISLIVIAYIPFLGAVYFSRHSFQVHGIPFLWIYMVFWVLLVFAVLVVLYVIDKRSTSMDSGVVKGV